MDFVSGTRASEQESPFMWPLELELRSRYNLSLHLNWVFHSLREETQVSTQSCHFFLFLAALLLAGLSRLPEFFFADPFFPPNTRAKILSTFFSWRGRSKAYSICWRGTRLVISLSASTR